MSECWSVLARAGFQSVTLRVDSDKKDGELWAPARRAVVGPSPDRSCRS